MMDPDPCKTCSTDLRDVNCKDRSRCTKLIIHTNMTYGKALEDMGWDLGGEQMWAKTRICSKCKSIIQRWVSARDRLEVISCDWRERTGCPAPIVPPRKQKPLRNCKKAQLHFLVKQSKYATLIKALREDKMIRPKWLHDIKKTIRAEMRALEQDECLFVVNSAENGSKELEWDKILEKIQNKAPTVYSIIFAAISKSDHPNRTNKHLKSRLGMMFLIPLHHRRPRFHRIPRHLPLTFARSLFKCDTAVKRVYPKKKSESSQQRVVCDRSGFTENRPAKPGSVVSHWRTTIEKEKMSTSGSLLAGADMHPGYSLVIASTRGKSQRLPVCNAFAVKNRVSFRELLEDTTVKASDLPLKTYLPSQKDYVELRMRMRVLVERILKANLYAFSHQSTLEHIPHQYSKECSRKSEYLDLRMIDYQENPNDTEGMLQILTRLSNLVPDDYGVPLHADQEAISMVRPARKRASKDPTSKKRLKQLHPVPQDLREVIVRDTIAELFSPTQATEKGTLRHLQVFFGLQSVDDQTSSFHHTDEFLLFIACAFVLGFAKEILRKPSHSRSIPKLGPIADEIVRRIWYQLPMNRVTDILNAHVKDHDDRFCFCKEDLEEADMVECCNIHCPNGQWFHQNCVMDVEAEGEWFCSSQCEKSNMGLFCICRQKGEEGTDLTCANKSCLRGKCFHSQCMRCTLPVQDEDAWYCSTECSKEGGGDGDERDELMEYLQRATWCSLFSECIRDAEREGDGMASMAYWRISMPELFARGHDQHVAATHRLLAGTSGCFPPRIREEVIHNRTINLQGGKGTNISLNFSTEELDDTPAQRSKQGKKPQSKRKTGKASNKQDKSTEWFARYQDDVKKFIDNFGDMFCEMKGRVVPSLFNKIVGQEITHKKATAMKKSLLKLNKKFDKEMMKYHHSV